MTDIDPRDAVRALAAAYDASLLGEEHSLDDLFGGGILRARHEFADEYVPVLTDEGYDAITRLLATLGARAMSVREAWDAVRRIKAQAVADRDRSEPPDIARFVTEGESWVTATLAAHGLSEELHVVTDIQGENARVSATNLLKLSDAQILAAARAAGIGAGGSPPNAVVELMMLTTMHSAGFTNGLALGLELGKRD